VALVHLLGHQELAVNIKVTKQGRCEDSDLVDPNLCEFLNLRFTLPVLISLDFFLGLIRVPLDNFFFDLKTIHRVFFDFFEVSNRFKRINRVNDFD
jgi:hypothetical protein